MASIRTRPETGLLYFDFRYQGIRCREQSALTDTPANVTAMKKVLERIEADIAKNAFDYSRYFPNGKYRDKFSPPTSSIPSMPVQGVTPTSVTLPPALPSFGDFADLWISEVEVGWRESTKSFNKTLLDCHIRPFFGTFPINLITRADVLSFRAAVAKGKHEDRPDKPRSASTVNHIMILLRQILNEAALRYGFQNPALGVKQLKQQKVDINPFTLEQVQKLLAVCRDDYRNYFTVRFFTGLRSGEANGLKWKHIDFERKQITIRETLNKGRTEYTKNDGSQRDVSMSKPVYEALLSQKTSTGSLSEYVFCSQAGAPINNENFNNRIWKPLLRLLGHTYRRPYQMRHTCATLWLGAGENPEWIAKQMGHTTTEMLFRVYSRYVPNLTRQDGSAFDRMVSAAVSE